VIHYDPWWNPAVESQATDRAHRIGQNKPVFVYKLIVREGIEGAIELLKSRKAALAEARYMARVSAATLAQYPLANYGNNTQLALTGRRRTRRPAPPCTPCN
jgi:hypothetical protein